MGQNYAVIVAAGRGSRIGGPLPKQFLKLDEDPIIIHTIKRFDLAKSIDHIIVVVADEYFNFMKYNILKEYKFTKPITLVRGAEERQDSVYNGLRALPKDTNIVSIHDGVRPFIDIELIDKSISLAKEVGAVIVGVPVKDTIKKLDKDDNIQKTLSREVLWQAQTPQVFQYNLIMKAHVHADKDGFKGTDDSSLVERLGIDVKMVMGSYKNLKITTGEDIYIAKSIILD